MKIISRVKYSFYIELDELNELKGILLNNLCACSNNFIKFNRPFRRFASMDLIED